MKAKLKGRIKSMRRTNKDGTGEGTLVAVEFDVEGKVEDVKSPDAKQVESRMRIHVSEMAAQDLRFGQELFVTIETAEGP